MFANLCDYRALILVLLVLLGPSTTPAADPSDYNLSQCLELARQNHPRIKLQQFRLRQAQELSRAAKTEFLPRLDAGYSFLYRDRINAYDIGGYSFPANTHDAYNLNVTLTQPLFSGFSLIENFRLRRLGIKQAQAEAELAHLEITYETTAAYFEYLKQLKFTDTADRTVARLEAQARDAQLFYDHELIPLSDLLYSRVKLSQARQQRLRAETAVSLARARLATIMQIERDRSFTISDEPHRRPMNFSLLQATELALKLRPELKLANYAIASAGHHLKLEQGKYYPTLTLQAEHTRMGNQSSLDGDGITSTPHNTTIAVAAGWRLWDWGERGHQIEHARAAAAEAEQALKQVSDEIALEIKHNYENAATSFQNIATAADEVELARENYRVTQLRYRNQLSTATEILDAQAALTEAEAGYFNALYEYNLLLAALARAAGVESWHAMARPATQ